MFGLQGHVAASTQSQALSAIHFLYAHVLERRLDRIESVFVSVARKA